MGVELYRYQENLHVDIESEVHTVKLRAVDRSTIQFLSIFGVVLTETCYYPRVTI